MSKEIKDYLHLYLPFEFTWIHDAVPFKKGESGIIDAENLKYWDDHKLPILRPIISMTKEEGYELCKLLNWRQDDAIVEDIKKEGILGFALTIQQQCEFVRCLLSKQFDLFGLIESGLAIDKTLQTV